MLPSRYIYLVLVAALSSACGSTLVGDAPAENPEQTFRAAQDAVRNHEWGAFFDLLTEKSQGDVKVGCIFMGMLVESAAPSGGEKEKNVAAQFEKVRRNHGLEALHTDRLQIQLPGETQPATKPEDTDDLRRIRELKDPRQFYVDAMTALLPVMTTLPLVDGRLRGLKIEGNVATAEYFTSPNNAPDQITPIVFKKVGDSWKIELQEPKHPKTSNAPAATQRS